jgi:hypothetical protein
MRFVLVIIVMGPLYWIFDTILDGLLPFLDTTNVFFIIMKAMWSFLLPYMFIISIPNYFISVRRKFE